MEEEKSRWDLANKGRYLAWKTEEKAAICRTMIFVHRSFRHFFQEIEIPTNSFVLILIWLTYSLNRKKKPKAPKGFFLEGTLTA
jgi:hypothetical protein